ncbi:peptide ABC transporter substrate-binding protein [Zhaonella formicivorans]|uniref:peptide ABC transporter substrate-binding protein n=1 Tax=Zhaonella formicivorans TaxID=2528593 RepID=UPI0010D29000|nr:peptide ABC transporter substrate-binding protein [Zhaonella formicivorans]
MWRNRKMFVVLAVVLMFSFVLTACGGGNKAANEGNKTEEKVITYNLGTEPETLDVATATGKPEATVQMAMFEGLTRLDANNQPVPGMAEKWDISPDGLVYTFHLRDAKWTNGDPVTAEDFEFAWKRLLNPDTAAEYSYQAFYIKNGEKYNAGEVSADEVGVKALDAKTLQVTLETPTPYFLSLTAFPNLYPVNKKVVEANPDWNTKVETLVGNGPFKIINWEHQQKIELVKNPDYWAADDVKIDKIIMTMVESEDTELSMFESGQIDIAENPPTQEVRRLLDEKIATMYPDLGIYYYMFNVKQEPFDDPRVRKAFAMAINRQAIIDNVTQAFQKPAFAVVPYGIPDAVPGEDFREKGGNNYFTEDVAKAKELLAEAGYPDGKGLPEIKILYNTNEGHQKIAEAIMEMWKKNLGANVTLTNQEWQVYLNTRAAGDYQVARAGWGADYTDAMTFLDMWMTGNGNNQTNWGNPEYDRLIKEAKSNPDPAVRIKAMHDAEKILMDEMPIMPIYFYTNVNMYKPWVKGVIVPMVGGYQEFRWAYIEK